MIPLRSRGLPVLLAVAMALAAPASAQSRDSGFKGNQLIMIIASSSGGGYDIQGRLLARHMGRHLPGNPGIVVQNMPGAGGILATNHLYAVAPKDGTIFALLQREVLTAKWNSPQNVQFDIGKLNWIGNIDSETGLVVAWHSAPIMTAADLMKKEMIIGGTGAIVDTETLPRLLNTLIGTKFRIVSGYPGTTEVLLAMQSGELMGIGDWSWSNIKSRNADMLERKEIRLLMQASVGRRADLPDLPSMLEYARNADDRQLMEVFLAQETVARPVAAPPGVPAERVRMLREAFMATVADADFLKEAEQAKLDLSPTSGEEVDRIVAMIGSTPAALIDRMVAAIAPPK